MKIKLSPEKIIKIECIKQDISIENLCNQMEMSRQLMWHHVKRNNRLILKKLENILSLKKGTLYHD